MKQDKRLRGNNRGKEEGKMLPFPPFRRNEAKRRLNAIHSSLREE